MANINVLISLLFVALPHLLLAALTTNNITTKIKTHPLSGLSIYELISAQGYDHENHTVETEDGYILEMHRVPRGKSNKAATRGPILLMHGLLANSAGFLINPRNESLGLLLADAGFDVWLGNSRGNNFGRRHKTLDPDDGSEFWNYNMYELGYYDMPAMIDYVLKVTNQKQLQYVGHSLGGGVFFIMGSERPEYLDKVKFMAGLAPASNQVHHKNKIIKFISAFDRILSKVLGFFGMYELLPYKKSLGNIAKIFCSEGMPTQELCRGVFFAIGGYSPHQLDKNFVPVIGSHLPSGVSVNVFAHLLQMVDNEGTFKKFDYHSAKKNKEMYGSPVPPKFKLDNIHVPIALYYSENDLLVSDKDTEALAKILPNVVVSKLVPDKYFNHLDFIFATEAKELLYDDLISNIIKYSD